MRFFRSEIEAVLKNRDRRGRPSRRIKDLEYVVKFRSYPDYDRDIRLPKTGPA